MRCVIIGNSYAGVGAIEGIRMLDRDAEITVVTDEPYLAYARPLISYYLDGRVTSWHMFYRKPGFYTKNKVKVVLSKRVVEIDCANQQICLDDGTILQFDKLLISTGGQPSLPTLAGLSENNFLSFTRWEDANKIKRIAKGKKNAVVFGGGLIGLKAAEGLNGLGLNVTIVARRRILAAVLDEVTGKMLEKKLRQKGITLKIGRTIKGLLNDQKGNPYGAILDNDTRLKCDIFIIAVGTKPRAELVKNTPIKTNKGIIVDKGMMTSVKNIYAAGDVAEALDRLNNVDSVIAIVPLAYEQGQVAGYNMAGGQRHYSGGISMNSIKVYDLAIITIGIANVKSDRYKVHTFKKGNVYRKLVFEGEKLVGAVLVNEINYCGILTRFIRSREDISDIKPELTEQVLKKGEFGPVLAKRWHAISYGA